MFSITETEMRNCETHGDYESSHLKAGRFDNWTPCPTCSDISQKKRDQELAAEFHEKARLARHECSGVPKRFEEKSFLNYAATGQHQVEVVDFCQTYADGFDNVAKSGAGIMLLGNVGTGKTHLAVSILRVVIDSGRRGRYATVSKIMRDVKETFSKYSEKSEAEVLNMYISTDLLVIDEVGVQRANDFEANTLFEVINGRYEGVKPTILIANLSAKEMRETIGDRAYDRMREGGGRQFVLSWDSYRGIAQ